MNLPNALSILRLILAPVFVLIFFLPESSESVSKVYILLLIIIFVLIELSDLFDGFFARKYNQVTPIGKLLDPFADVIGRLSFFLCYTMVGIMPFFVFLILFYRELSIVFLRMYMVGKGIIVAANKWGKLKAISYTVSGALGLFWDISERLGLIYPELAIFRSIVVVFFYISAFAAIVSFIIYAIPAIKTTGSQDLNR